MNRLSTFLLTGLLWLMSNIALAQGPTFTITPQTQAVTAGSTVSFTVNVSNFTNIEGIQFSMTWDAAKLTYVNVSDMSLSGLTIGNFASNSANPSLGLSWTSPTGSGVSVPNGVFYKVNFTALTTGTVALNFCKIPVSFEITGAGSSDVTNQSSLVPGALSSYGGGGSTGGTCNAPSGITATPANTTAAVSWSAATGATSYNVQYKATSASTWTSASTSIPSFTVPSLVTCTDYEVQVQTVCASGSSTFSASTAFKTTGCSSGGGTGGTCWTCSQANTLSGFGLIFSDDYQEAVGGDVTTKLYVNSFNKIEGMQFEIKWDPSKLQYKSLTPTLTNLTLGGLNIDAANGRIGLTWTDPNGTGLSISDCTSILEIQFKALGVASSTSSVYINTVNASPSLEITANGGQDVKVAASNLIAGKMILKKCDNTVTPSNCTTPTYDKTFNIKNTTVKSLDNVCVDVVVSGFTKIDGFQYSITWDPTKLNFLTVKNTGLTNLMPGQYNVDGANGLMTIAYNADSPLTLADGTSIFQLCFIASANNGSVADIKIGNSPLTFETYANSGVLATATSQNGKITIAESPVVTMTEVTASCNGTKTGSMKAEATPFNAATTYSYVWSGPTGAISATTQTITGLVNGSYRATVTDNTTCLSGVGIAILSNKAAPKITKLVQTNNGLSADATNGTDFKWFNTANPSVVIGTGKDLTGIQPGIYKLTVANAAGCTKDTVATYLKAIPAVTNSKCGNDGKIIIDDGGVSTLKYTWSPNISTSNTANNLAPGIYKVSIEETVSKAIAYLDITVAGANALTLATITVTAAPNACATASATGGTGSYSYQWNDLANTKAAQVCGLSAFGAYFVTITDENGCTVTNAKPVIPLCPALVLAQQNVTAVNTTCGQNNGSITIDPKGGSGDFKYTWAGPTTGNGKVLTNLSAGTYNVTIADNQCPSQIKYNDIVINPSTGINASLDKAVDAKDNCTGSIALLVANGVAPYTFAWSLNANGQTVKDPTNLCEGIYAVTITDAQLCVKVISDITVSGTSVPQVDDVNTKLTKSTCPNSNDGKIDLVVKGGKAPFVYTWKYNGTTYPVTTGTITNALPGKYDVTVTDAANKSFTKTYVLASESNLDFTVKVTDPVPSNSKTGAAIAQILDGVAPYIYTWSNGGTGNQINNLGTGTYTLTITDANGCKVVKSFPVGDVGAVEIVIRTNFNGVNVRCFGMCNAIAEVKNVSDAVPPLKYKWSTGDTSSIAKGLCIGTHKVVVTDANNEKFEGAVTILGPDKIDLIMKTTDATNGKDGKAEVTILGGTAPFNYRWNNDVISSIITNQLPGRVFVMVTDANGCDAFKDGIIGPRGGDLDCLTAIPVITPNNDGYNDYLDIYCLEEYSNNQLDVFNRYGQLVFTKTNYINRTWQPLDSKGNPLPDGGYFYVIDVTNSNGTHNKVKGSFNILNQ